MMLQSALIFQKNSRQTILSDLHTDFAHLQSKYRVVRKPISPDALMLERAALQHEYISRHDFSRPIVLIDSDILINGPLAPLFEKDFDVALTWRDNADMPINGGLIILNNRRPEITKRFFSKFTSIYNANHSTRAAWYGDQLALRDYVGLNVEEFKNKDIIEIDGCRILLLPCEIYNFSPDNRYGSITSDLATKTILHFKGQRKNLMPYFWHAWLRPKISFNPWWRIKARQWRKKIHELSASEPPFSRKNK